MGRPYAEVVATLHRIADRLGIEIATFGNMSVEQVAVDCGMPLLQARLAKFREYTEPFRLLRDDADVKKLLRILRSSGLSCSSLPRAPMFALMAVMAVIVAVFAYDLWKTWRRTTAWRRAAKDTHDRQD